MIKNANNNPLHLTLREMQLGYLNKQFVIWMTAAVIVLTIAGPFGTLRAFNTLERFAYWLILTPTTFLLASFCSTFIVITLSKFSINKWACYGVAGVMSGIPVGISVWIFQFILNEHVAPDLDFLITMISSTIPITLAVNMIYASRSKSGVTKINAAESSVSNDLFFNRLSKKLGHDVISLNAQDHYVEVKTTLGSELILMRMSDAISELTDIEGFQTHRSWWVAKKHILAVRSDHGKKSLELTDKTKVPVSRSFSKNILGLIQ